MPLNKAVEFLLAQHQRPIRMAVVRKDCRPIIRYGNVGLTFGFLKNWSGDIRF